MRFEWAIPCMGVKTEPDGRVSALHDFGFDTICVDEIPTPTQIEIIIVVRVVGLREDFHEDSPRNAEVYFIGPGPDPLLKADALIAMDFEIRTGEPAPDHPEGWEVFTMIPLVMRFTPKTAGHHLFEFYVNGKVQKCFIPMRIMLKDDVPSN
jgi:hypothetical protein